MGKPLIFAALALSLLLGGVVASDTARAARPLIDIEGAAFRPFPVAIPDFLAKSPEETQLALEMTAVLRNDLALTGLFQVLDPRSFIASPQREGVTVGTISFPAWLNVGADGLIKAAFEKRGGMLTVEVHVFDVVRGRETLKKSFKSMGGQPRRLAHKVADAIVEHYTGEKGLFLSRIAFVQRRGRGKDVCVMDVDGHNVDCVVKDGGLNMLPAWDGIGSILFTSYRAGNPDVYRVSLKGRSVDSVSTRPGLNSGAASSPGGGAIALTLSRDGNSEVYVIDSSGANPRRLTNQPWAIDSSPSWSPDGKRIAFVSDRAGSPQIYVMNADGSGATRLTFQGNYNQTPAWSPRGDRIAFTARDERNRFDIFTIELSSGTVERITQDQGNNEEPTWSPNGRMLAFISDRHGSKAIYLTDVKGNNQQRVSKGKAPCYTPSWSRLMPKLK